MNVALDSNVVVSAAINPSGVPGQVIRAWTLGRFLWVTSTTLLGELERALSYDRVRRASRWTDQDVALLMSWIRQQAEVASVTEAVHIIAADPDDDRVLEAALAGNADYIVSGDRHLLALEEFEGIRILRPSEFLVILEARGYDQT